MIYLTGLRGSGKTTLGRMLAKRLDLAFVDLDDLVAQQANRSITEIVAQEGWTGFRERESESLASVAHGGGRNVVATGGGIVLSAANRQLMRKTGKVFWLCAPAQELALRLAKTPEFAKRPSLTGKGIVEEMKEIAREREHLYRACAHFAIRTDAGPEQTCDRIMAMLAAAEAKQAMSQNLRR